MIFKSVLKIFYDDLCFKISLFRIITILKSAILKIQIRKNTEIKVNVELKNNANIKYLESKLNTKKPKSDEIKIVKSIISMVLMNEKSIRFLFASIFMFKIDYESDIKK